MNDLPPKKQLNVLSLFSGCGGMDLGFEGGFQIPEDSIGLTNYDNIVSEKNKHGWVTLKQNRFKTVFANDILAGAEKTWTNYFKLKRGSDAVFYSDSIVDLVKRHNSGEVIFPDNIDVVTGGFPCQDFSVAGKRQGFNSSKSHLGSKIELISEATEETRGMLYMWMKQVIDITKPNIFIAENVKGLVNLSNVKEIIQHDFSEANGSDYIVLDPKVLHAGNYGVAQSRERVFFIGIKKSALNSKALVALTKNRIDSEYDPYPTPTHWIKKDLKEGLREHLKLRTLFKGLEEPENSNDLSHKYFSKAKFMGRHCQGQTEVKLSGIGPTIRAEHHGNIEFRRLSKKNGGKSEEIKSGLQERRLTPRECAMIQSFPPDFNFVIAANDGRRKFSVSPSMAYKVIGNAVPPLLAFHVANRIELLWEKFFD